VPETEFFAEIFTFFRLDIDFRVLMLFIGKDSVQNILATFSVCSQNTFIYQKLYTRLRQRIESRPVRAHIKSLILDSFAGISLNALPLFSKQQLID